MFTAMNTFKPDPGSPVYLYVQVADYITGLIESGEPPAGVQLLAERDLAGEYDISLQAARRAVRELRDRGLAQTVPWLICGFASR